MTRRRPGFTLLELVVVMAILLVLGALLIPTLTGMKGNTGVKAGADMVRARMFDARSRAMDDGISYRLSLSDDGRTLQVAPDDPNAQVDSTHATTLSTENLPLGITVQVTAQDGMTASADQTGWVRLATFQADGTCREDFVEVVVADSASQIPPIAIRIRGVTGAIRTVKTAGTR